MKTKSLETSSPGQQKETHKPLNMSTSVPATLWGPPHLSVNDFIHVDFGLAETLMIVGLEEKWSFCLSVPLWKNLMSNHLIRKCLLGFLLEN